ncbi:bifunctional 4-hydroxy-2-oxoglutarate aldolase/2-dehydro-3-deoxy-phosphogluconate aldolase [Fulvivirgaceae bacterium PWU4]|uniref:Bifunctional 4-hydroxy-2-oxoglutarate aldolase/2-dehydro-3-deoxy-phosphogluconate aldolase n=1 Tax=Chryseosolibacter histidini TaxID=2782349 RepID=A0AAP2DSU9_9BACT|nr:bifunctional 4-hydroxy-2-oxoglutarate aldolase/2-dehydro-3-deoxy-phosphogluconate aldolase [Chryseosolibacter histidini]MBT1700693.1 bifunctional 4-hydroxy-2-oxoglutarate aldolase/2-dehydro-3-deoxy-phosphogluconate aldolase [Chryseosolibacter histidini]
MAFSKQQIFDEMKRTGIVPLFTHDNPEEAQQVLQAAYAGGVRVFEFTNRRKNSFEIFQHLHRQRNHFPDLMLGIGTIMDGATTKKFIDAGADFIISPIMKPEMAEVCHRHDKLWIPGCATLTEIVTAKDNGAVVIKVFPGSVLGPGFVSSIMPVVPDLNLMITGGVEPTEQNLSAWFKAGAMCVGMGSQLFTKEILQQRNWDLLKQKVSEAMSIVKKIQSNQ